MGVQEPDGGIPQQGEVLFGPVHQDQVVAGISVPVIGRQDLLQRFALFPQGFAVGRQDVVTGDALDERLLGRAQAVPHGLVDDHVGDQELLLPARQMHVAVAHGAGIALRQVEQLGVVVDGGGEFERLQLAVRDSLHQGASPGDRLDELDVLLRDHPACHEVVAGAIQDVLGGRQVAEGPVLPAHPGQSDTGRRPRPADGTLEIARQLLAAPGDGNGHDVRAVAVEDALELLEAGL